MADFWKPPTKINETIYVMIHSGFMDKFDQLLTNGLISYQVEIEDFSK
uniref:Propep_M14 domain-containing protein n=1 Tax=Elaeophora elaphi TaxID=1147741 RepID=A0A0R3RKX4_9BILA